MKTTLQQTSYAWKQIAENWETYFFAPSRPSSQEVRKYKKWLIEISEKKRGLNALVLGATPELRDALNQLHFNTHSLDINIEMILALNDLVDHKNPEEVLIRANWLESPLRDNYFDVILGDAVFPNIPWEKRDEFYQEIIRMLKPNGHFINRAFYAPLKKRYNTIEEILSVFAKKKASNKTAIELVFEIQLLTHDPKDRLGSMEKVRDVIEKLYSSKGFTFASKELNITLEIIRTYWLGSVTKKVWIYPYQHEEEAEYVKYFSMKKTFIATDQPYGKLTPLYLLKSLKS